MKGEIQNYYSIDYARLRGSDQTEDNINFNFSNKVLNAINEGLPNYQHMN